MQRGSASILSSGSLQYNWERHTISENKIVVVVGEVDIVGVGSIAIYTVYLHLLKTKENKSTITNFTKEIAYELYT